MWRKGGVDCGSVHLCGASRTSLNKNQETLKGFFFIHRVLPGFSIWNAFLGQVSLLTSRVCFLPAAYNTEANKAT